MMLIKMKLALQVNRHLSSAGLDPDFKCRPELDLHLLRLLFSALSLDDLL